MPIHDNFPSTNAAPSDEIANLASAAMHANDRVAANLQIEIVSVSVGYAVVTLTVSDIMVNGHDICHGGYIFLLADTAMAHASNSHNQNAVASAAQIDWLRPAKQGERLTATAIEQVKAGRSGIYDVTITNDSDELIAVFRGKTRQINGVLVDIAS